MAATAKLFKNGSSQAVRLPRAFRFPGTQVAIHREGDKVILAPLVRARWPRNFFAAIRITDPGFARPPQGDIPPAPHLGA